MLSFLQAVGTDLELLARARALSSNEIVWPHGVKKFALEYLAHLRRLGSGPLVDVGVINRPIQIDVDAEISWISEKDSPGKGDVVNIVTTAARPHIVGLDGTHFGPVMTFSTSGHHGASIEIKVPHYSAFSRVKYEVEKLVEKGSLLNEGPDIVYERLCSFAKRFTKVVDMAGGTAPTAVADLNIHDCTASTLHAKFRAAVASILDVDESCIEVGDKSMVFVPGKREITVVEGTDAPVDSLVAHLCVHGVELAQLVDQAARFRIADLPLHPLGLLPFSGADPVLALPNDQDLLHGASLHLFVQRHELGNMRGFRHLVESNFGGLKLFLRQYSSMPWRIEIAIEERVDRELLRPHIRSVRHFHSEIDEVVQVSDVSEEDARWSSRSSMFAYQGVRNAAYRLVEQDLRDVMSGSIPLGSVDL